MVKVEVKVHAVQPQELSKNFKAVIMSLGATAIGTLYGAITLALTNLTKQAVDAGIAALEKQAAVVSTRAMLVTLQNYIAVFDKAKESCAPYIKCLELVPEVRTAVVQAVSSLDSIASDARSYLNKLERLTYMSDLATQLVDALNAKIASLLSTQELLKKLLDELPTIPAIDLAITLGALLQYPCEICPPLDPIIKKGRDEINKASGLQLL